MSPQRSEIGLQEMLPSSGGKALGTSKIRLQKASMPAPNVSRPQPVLLIDGRYEERISSLPAPDSALRALTAACEPNSSSERQLGPLFSSCAVVLAATTAAAQSETEVRSSSESYGFYPLLYHLVARGTRFNKEAACLLYSHSDRVAAY